MPCTRDIIDDCVPRSRSLDGLESTSRWLSFRNAPRRPLRFEDPGNGPSWTSACADYDVDQRPLSESDVKRESLSTPQNAAAGLSCTPLFLIPIPLLADHSVRAHFQRATGSDSPTPRSQATAPTSSVGWSGAIALIALEYLSARIYAATGARSASPSRPK